MESFQKKYDEFRGSDSSGNSQFFLIKKFGIAEIIVGKLADWEKFFESTPENEVCIRLTVVKFCFQYLNMFAAHSWLCRSI